MEKNREKDYRYIHILTESPVVYLKLIQYCKSTILKRKKEIHTGHTLSKRPQKDWKI